MMNKRPGYGVDAPGVLRNLFIFGFACVLAGIFIPASIHLGRVDFHLKRIDPVTTFPPLTIVVATKPA